MPTKVRTALLTNAWNPEITTLKKKFALRAKYKPLAIATESSNTDKFFS